MGWLLVWGWNREAVQARWAAHLGPAAYQDYELGVAELKAGNLDQARFHLGRVLNALGNRRPDPTPPPTPYTLPPPPIATPTFTPPPAPSPSASPLAPTPEPTHRASPSPAPAIHPTVTALIQQAEALADKAPCAAEELMSQALSLSDTPDIEARRQELDARCRGVFSSPLPAPSPLQTILFTTYDTRAGRYAIRAWSLGSRLPGPPFIEGAMQPAWGLHGEVIYRYDDAITPGLHLRQTDGVIQRITKGGEDSHPRWGPDGRQAIFTSVRRNADQTPWLYLVDIATRSVEALTPGQNADWSRDGRIVFHGCDAGGERCGLWLLDPVTLQRTQLTDNPADNSPAWSPDGRFIAFMSSGRSESWDVFLLDMETGDIIPTSLHPAEDGLPAWSPDGRAVALLSNRAGDWAIYAWSLDDLTAERLIPVAATLPNWQQAGFDWSAGGLNP